MGALTYEHEDISSVPPSRFFKARVIDADNLIPKVFPVKSIENLEGGKKCITLDQGSMTHHIHEIDEANLTFKYSLIDGQGLEDIFNSVDYVLKFEPTPEGGSVCKTTSTYHTKGEELKHKIEEKIEEDKAKAKGLFHAIEAHLHAHPDEYCN